MANPLESGSPSSCLLGLPRVRCLDTSQEVGPAGRVGKVIGPHEALEEDTVPGGGLSDPLVGRKLVRVVGGLEPLESPAAAPIGPRPAGEASARSTSPALPSDQHEASATASKHPPRSSRTARSVGLSHPSCQPVETVAKLLAQARSPGPPPRVRRGRRSADESDAGAPPPGATPRP